MSVSGYQPPSRDVALARAAWLDEKSEGVGAFMGWSGLLIAMFLAAYILAVLGAPFLPIMAALQGAWPAQSQGTMTLLWWGSRKKENEATLLVHSKVHSARLWPLLGKVHPMGTQAGSQWRTSD